MSVNEEGIRDALSVFGERASKLVQLTLADSERLMHDLEIAIHDRDPEAAGNAAHALKSIMKQIAAMQVSDVAFEIEKHGREGSIEKCAECFEVLKVNYGETKTFLEGML